MIILQERHRQQELKWWQPNFLQHIKSLGFPQHAKSSYFILLMKARWQQILSLKRIIIMHQYLFFVVFFVWRSKSAMDCHRVVVDLVGVLVFEVWKNRCGCQLPILPRNILWRFKQISATYNLKTVVSLWSCTGYVCLPPHLIYLGKRMFSCT